MSFSIDPDFDYDSVTIEWVIPGLSGIVVFKASNNVALTAAKLYRCRPDLWQVARALKLPAPTSDEATHTLTEAWGRLQQPR